MSTPFVDTSSLAGIERASRTPVQDYPRGSAPNLPAVRRTLPQFDFSDTAMEQRRLAAQQLAQQRLDTAAEEAQFGTEAGYTPYNLEAAYGEVRSAYFAMLNSYSSPRAQSLTRYPELAAMALEADVDQRDVAKLINLVEVDRAAETVVASLNLVYNAENNPDKRILGNRQIEQTLMSMNPVMRAATWDVVAEKIAAAADSPDDVPNALVEGIKFGAGKALEALFFVPIWAAEQMQRGIRASEYGRYVEGEYDPIGINTIQNIFEYWDKVETGKYNQEILAAGRQQVGDLPIDLVLQVEQAKASGDPDPLITVLGMNSANPEAMAILEPLFYAGGDGGDMAEAARIVDNANLGNTGQVLMTTALRDQYLGAGGRAAAAGTLNVYSTLVLDPTIIGSKVRAGYLATRFALEKIAPGATSVGIRAAFQMRPVRRYYGNLLRDLERYDDLVGSDPVAAGVLREQIRRQYPETPDYVIDEWREQGIRTIDDLSEHVIEQNGLYAIQNGKAADELVSADVENVTPLFNAIVSDGQALRRDMTLPRMTLTRALKTEFSRTVSKAMPRGRGRAVVEGAYDSTTDPAEFAAMMRDPATAAKAGAIEREGAVVSGVPGGFGKKVDSFFKYFGSLGLGYVSIADGRDAKLIYRYGRSFLSRNHATYIADRWRQATPAQRYDILVGLNRTAAAAKGIDLTDPEMLGRVDQLITATRETNRFAAKSKPLSTPDVDDARIAGEFTDPSDFNGVSKALFDWQTAEYVALPNIREMEQLGRWYRMLESRKAGWVASLPQRTTDAWSLATLYGLRFSMRSAIEDLWFYAVITGGNIGDLYKGRRASTAIREARGRTRQGAWASLFGKAVPKQALGMFNKRLRRIGDAIDNSNSEAVRSFGKFIQANLPQADVEAAYAAAKKGDFVPMRNLAGVALTNAKMNGLSSREREYILDLMEGPLGLKLLDELAETGRSINSGGLPDMSLTVPGADVMGVAVDTVPRTQPRMGPTGDWDATLPTENSNVGAMLSWERFLNGVMLNDGPVGKIIVANLDDVERAVELAANEIRRDPTKFGYMKKFAALEDVTVEEFARRKVQAVRAGFSDAQGNLNEKLWRKVVGENGEVVAFDIAEDGSRVYRIDQNVLRNVPSESRPQYVLGQEYGVIPTPTGVGAFADNTWAWMGEQYARISREPIFIANYLAHRKQLSGYQRQLAEQIGDKAAKRVVSRMAEDRAYNFTIAYTDNPANRSLLAYKVRNVSRYYRATEDFYRRMMRAGKNYPVGLWKTALTYDVLDDTGFVYEDDEGNKYFMYPGSKELMDVTAWFIGARGSNAVKMDYPFFLGAKVNMLAPSTDPNQLFPTISGPFAGFSWRLAQQAIPSLSRFNKLVLGEYGQSPDPTIMGAIYESFAPAGLSRVLNAMDADERDSMYGAAFKDALAVAVANGAIPAGAGPEAMNTPEFGEAMAGINAIAWSSVIVRFAMSWMVPASPQRYIDNVSDYARLQGVVSLRGGFLDLIQKKADAGAENPVGEAFVDWYRLNPNLFPYTVSKTEADLRPGKSYAPLKTAEEVFKWHRNNREGLIKQYPDTAYFLAPQTEGFNWDTWGLLMGEGLRIEKDQMTFLRDVYAAYGEFEHYATIADYQADIEALDPRDPEQYRQINQLEDQRAADLELIRQENHWWKLKYEQTRNFNESQGTAEFALVSTKKMVDELYDSTPEEEWQGSPAQAIRNVILTYLDYQSEINSITGQTDEENLRKRTLRFELRRDLELFADENPNAKLFITTVLYRDPGLEMLDYTGSGVQ